MRRPAYASDLSDREWELPETLPPPPGVNGRPLKCPRREIVNGIRYVLRTGCAWRLLPRDLPPWRILYHCFRTWRRAGVWQRAQETLRRHSGQSDREDHGKRGSRVVAAGKKVNGRKRRPAVDVQGILLAVHVHAADIQDRDGARELLRRLSGRCPRLRRLWADGAYAGALQTWVRDTFGWHPETVRRPAGQTGFAPLPRRRAVERSCGRLNLQRRLSKDFEVLCETAEAWIRIAQTGMLLARLAAREANQTPSEISHQPREAAAGK